MDYNHYRTFYSDYPVQPEHNHIDFGGLCQRITRKLWYCGGLCDNPDSNNCLVTAVVHESFKIKRNHFLKMKDSDFSESFLCYRKVLSSVMVSAEKHQIRIMIDTDFTKKNKT